MNLNLAPALLAEYQEAQHRAKQMRHQCLDCESMRAEDQHAICNICRGICCNCGSEDVAYPGRTMADGRQEWWCAACSDREPTTPDWTYVDEGGNVR